MDEIFSFGAAAGQGARELERCAMAEAVHSLGGPLPKEEESRGEDERKSDRESAEPKSTDVEAATGSRAQKDEVIDETRESERARERERETLGEGDSRFRNRGSNPFAASICFPRHRRRRRRRADSASS